MWNKYDGPKYDVDKYDKSSTSYKKTIRNEKNSKSKKISINLSSKFS